MKNWPEDTVAILLAIIILCIAVLVFLLMPYAEVAQVVLSITPGLAGNLESWLTTADFGSGISGFLKTLLSGSRPSSWGSNPLTAFPPNVFIYALVLFALLALLLGVGVMLMKEKLKPFVKGFGFDEGAIACSVGHDSHNITCVGASDEDMALACNRIKEMQGGYVIVKNGKVLGELPLPIAGLMSDKNFEDVCEDLEGMRAASKELGSALEEPTMMLAFLPLCVIPSLKIKAPLSAAPNKGIYIPDSEHTIVFTSCKPPDNRSRARLINCFF